MKYKIPEFTFTVNVVLTAQEVMYINHALAGYEKKLRESQDPGFSDWLNEIQILRLEFEELLEEIPEHYCTWL